MSVWVPRALCVPNWPGNFSPSPLKITRAVETAFTLREGSQPLELITADDHRGCGLKLGEGPRATSAEVGLFGTSAFPAIDAPLEPSVSPRGGYPFDLPYSPSCNSTASLYSNMLTGVVCFWIYSVEPGLDAILRAAGSIKPRRLAARRPAKAPRRTLNDTPWKSSLSAKPEGTLGVVSFPSGASSTSSLSHEASEDLRSTMMK